MQIAFGNLHHQAQIAFNHALPRRIVALLRQIAEFGLILGTQQGLQANATQIHPDHIHLIITGNTSLTGAAHPPGNPEEHTNLVSRATPVTLTFNDYLFHEPTLKQSEVALLTLTSSPGNLLYRQKFARIRRLSVRQYYLKV